MYMRLKQVIGVVGILLLLVTAMVCQAGSSSHQSQVRQNIKGSNMTMYKMLFADYQYSSFQEQTSNVVGEQVWVTPNSDSTHKSPPTAILLSPQGLTVQYNDRLEQMTYDGKIVWELERDPGLDIFIHNDAIYYRSTGRRLAAVDFEKNTVLDAMHIMTSSRRGFFYLVLPRDNQRFLVQTFNRAPEPEPNIPDEHDNYNLVLMGPSGDEWLHEFEGEVLPGLVTHDSKKVMLLTDNSDILSFDTDTGEQLDSFSLPGVQFLQASMDRNDNLVVAMLNQEKKQVHACINVSDGKTLWEKPFPDDGPHTFRQPPAIGSDNQVYYITNDTLHVIKDGELLWRYPVPEATFYQYLTILADNSVLLSASDTLIHLDAEGEVLAAVVMENSGELTTPPVVDDKGRCYVGSGAGIYCIK